MLLKKNYQNDIRQHRLFNRMSDESFHEVMLHSDLLFFKKNKLVFEYNSKADHFYLVRSGKIVIFQNSESGKEKIIDIYEPGEVFAESLLFSENPYYGLNARAIINTELYCFDAKTYKAQLKQSSELCFTLMTELSNRISIQNKEIVELSIYDAQYRLVNYLLKKCCWDDQKSCNSSVILSTTKALLASRLSITSETFSRVLGTLKKQGLITIKHETITINKPSKLRNLIEHCN